MRSAAPVNVTLAVARTETVPYVPAGTRMLTTCGSVASAAPEQSLPGLAPGRTVPVQDTVTVWPCAVGTVSWSAAREPGTIVTTRAIASMPTGTRRRTRTCLPPTLAGTARASAHADDWWKRIRIEATRATTH